MRRCQNCQDKLPGVKGHGWLSPDGKAVFCSFCAFPNSRGYKLKTIRQSFGVTPTRYQNRLDTPTHDAKRAQAWNGLTEQERQAVREERAEERLLETGGRLGYV